MMSSEQNRALNFQLTQPATFVPSLKSPVIAYSLSRQLNFPGLLTGLLGYKIDLKIPKSQQEGKQNSKRKGELRDAVYQIPITIYNEICHKDIGIK